MTSLDLPRTIPSLALGLDVGGTNISLVAADQSDRLLLEATVPTDAARLGCQVNELAQESVGQLRSEGHRVGVVGVAVAGLVDPQGRTVNLAVNLRAGRLPLAALLEESLELPCVVEHDARAAAHWLLARGNDPRANLAYLSVGTGISAGVVIDGRLLRGATGLAGEIGHVSVMPDGPACACGLHGCLEAVAAGPALARMAAEAIQSGASTSLRAGSSPAEIFAAALAGDELAGRLVSSMAARLARAVRSLVLGFGVQRVVVGGGVAAAGRPLLERIESHIVGERQASALIDAAFEAVTLELLPADSRAGARGAAAIALAAAGRPLTEARPITDERGVAQREGVGSP